MKTVRIGGASASMVDSIVAVSQLLKADPPPDYLMFDFMAEAAIGMMAQARKASPTGGYISDLITFHIAPNLKEIVSKKVKLVANAGGLNVKACAEAVKEFLSSQGVALKVAYIVGDDILASEAELREIGTREMFSGEGFPERVDSINIYLGAFPIAQALAAGADIVITGRCADSALALGPLIHEFGWGPRDWDRLAAGTLVGHLIECGCQATGGTFTDWEEVPDWENIGFPLADVSADGTCVITKPEGTGGLVSVGTVSEQLLYEVSDPQAYIVPDVVCDFGHVKMEQAGENRVAVSGARGYPATDTHKGVASYQAGWRGMYSQVVIGIDAVRKAEHQGAVLLERSRRILDGLNMGGYLRADVDAIGSESTYGPRSSARNTREVFMRASVDHEQKRAAELFVRESLVTSSAMAQGSTATISASVTPVTKLFMFLVKKRGFRVSVVLDEKVTEVSLEYGQPFDAGSVVRPVPPEAKISREDMIDVPLIKLAWGRSGDKGNLFNVAVIARQPRYLPYIRAELTEGRVGEFYAHLSSDGVNPKVTSYEVPGINALNFVVHDSLDGGVMASPRADSAAKGMAQQLLEIPIRVPASLFG